MSFTRLAALNGDGVLFVPVYFSRLADYSEFSCLMSRGMQVARSCVPLCGGRLRHLLDIPSAPPVSSFPKRVMVQNVEGVDGHDQA